MLLVELAFNLLLRADAGVGAIADDRIYASFAPQTATFPLIVHRVESRNHVMCLDGPAGLRETRMRVYSAAKTYEDAKELDEAVRLCVQGFKGIVADNTSPSNILQIQFIECVFSHDLYDVGETFTVTNKTHQIVSDYVITAPEAIPA